MKTLKSISELHLLKAASFSIMDDIEEEENHLQKSPDSPITRARMDRHNKQLKEISNKIIELEK